MKHFFLFQSKLCYKTLYLFTLGPWSWSSAAKEVGARPLTAEVAAHLVEARPAAASSWVAFQEGKLPVGACQAEEGRPLEEASLAWVGRLQAAAFPASFPALRKAWALQTSEVLAGSTG